MAARSTAAAAAAVTMMGLAVTAAALLSPATAPGDMDNDEVKALLAIRAALVDPGRALGGWDATAGGDDPCGWPMVTCDQGQVSGLSLGHRNLSGTLSPAIGGLTWLQNLSLCNNAIYGPIPDTIGRMEFLQSLDLSNNQFTGSIPSTLGDLASLQYLKLNNNSLSGTIPHSLATSHVIYTLDLSFNNLSGTWPLFHARTVLLGGNPFLTAPAEEPLHLPMLKPTNTEADSEIMDGRVRILCILALCIAIGCSLITVIAALIMLFRRGRQREQVAAVDDMSSALSVTDSGLSQFSISTIVMLP